ncbi:TenA family protein [bacterium]|nr:TenA family protein [bacterium]
MLTTDILWDKALPIIKVHLDHPFSKALANGTLSKEVFRYYLQQDAIYIKKYAEAMSILAKKAPRLEIQDIFAQLSSDSYELEHIFQAELFKKYQVESSNLMQAGCLAYSNYLIATISTGSFIEGLTSLLPCFWVYLENGKNIAKNSQAKNPYQSWIDTYVSDEFIAQTELVKKYVNIYSENISPSELEKLSEIFSYSCRLDLQFMDDAFNLRKWLV